jgi:hypothetical protein
VYLNFILKLQAPLQEKEVEFYLNVFTEIDRLQWTQIRKNHLLSQLDYMVTCSL